MCLSGLTYVLSFLGLSLSYQPDSSKRPWDLCGVSPSSHALVISSMLENPPFTSMNLPSYMVVSWVIGLPPSHRATPYVHPFIDGIFPEKPSILMGFSDFPLSTIHLGVPPFMETPISTYHIMNWIYPLTTMMVHTVVNHYIVHHFWDIPSSSSISRLDFP